MNFLSAVLTILSSFLITFLLMPSLIKYFRAKKEGQQIRKEGPTWHAKKAGTPTMGGLLFIFSAVVTILWVAAWQGLITNTLWALLFVLVVYGLIGMWDDSIKIFHHQNEGFKPWQKALCQVLAAMVFTVIYQHEGFQMGFGTTQIGWLYGLFIIFWIVGFSNAVNLTDGLDKRPFHYFFCGLSNYCVGKSQSTRLSGNCSFLFSNDRNFTRFLPL